jgi:hypothetical protein
MVTTDAALCLDKSVVTLMSFKPLTLTSTDARSRKTICHVSPRSLESLDRSGDETSKWAGPDAALRGSGKYRGGYDRMSAGGVETGSVTMARDALVS